MADLNTLITTGISTVTTGDTNVPMGKNPDGEVIVLVEEGSVSVEQMGGTGTAVFQTLTGLERYGNTGLSQYRRFIFPDEDPATGLTEWSEWLKID